MQSLWGWNGDRVFFPRSTAVNPAPPTQPRSSHSQASFLTASTLADRLANWGGDHLSYSAPCSVATWSCIQRLSCSQIKHCKFTKALKCVGVIQIYNFVSNLKSTCVFGEPTLRWHHVFIPLALASLTWAKWLFSILAKSLFDSLGFHWDQYCMPSTIKR